MKKFLISCLFILCFFSVGHVRASEITEDSPASEYVSMDVSVGLQSVFTNEIPIIVKFTPNTDSKKASIEWDLPYGIESDSDLKQWFPIEERTEYEVKVWVSAKEKGTYSIPVNVDIWLYNASHVNTKSITFKVDENLRVTPISPEYIRNYVLKWVAIVLLLGVVAFLVWKVWTFYYPRFYKWLNS